MNELKDVDVGLISLVHKGANGEPIKLYKSDEHVEPGEPAVTTEPAAKVEEVAKTEEATATSLLAKIKEFLGISPVKKSQDLDVHIDYSSFTSRINDKSARLDDAVNTLLFTIWDIFWDNTIEDGKGLILKNIDEFKAYVEGVLNSTEVQKSQDFFKKNEEVDNVNKEEIQKMIGEAVSPLSEAITQLGAKLEGPTTEPDVEKSDESGENKEPETNQAETTAEDSLTKEDLSSLLKEALEPLAKSIGGVAERVETLEQVRGLSKSSNKETKVAKSEDPWAGVLGPIFGD